MRNVNRAPNRDFTGWGGPSLYYHLSHLVHWLFPLGFLFLWYSISSTVQTAPFTFSTLLKHLWRLRLCRTAFWRRNIYQDRYRYIIINMKHVGFMIFLIVLATIINILRTCKRSSLFSLLLGAKGLAQKNWVVSRKHDGSQKIRFLIISCWFLPHRVSFIKENPCINYLTTLSVEFLSLFDFGLKLSSNGKKVWATRFFTKYNIWFNCWLG